MIYKDMGDFEEDERIAAIGKAAMEKKQTVGFVTDSDPGKLDRYIKKLRDRFPGIVLVSRGEGPVENTVWAKVGPPVN